MDGADMSKNKKSNQRMQQQKKGHSKQSTRNVWSLAEYITALDQYERQQLIVDVAGEIGNAVDASPLFKSRSQIAATCKGAWFLYETVNMAIEHFAKVIDHEADTGIPATALSIMSPQDASPLEITNIEYAMYERIGNALLKTLRLLRQHVDEGIQQLQTDNTRMPE